MELLYDVKLITMLKANKRGRLQKHQLASQLSDQPTNAIAELITFMTFGRHTYSELFT